MNASSWRKAADLVAQGTQANQQVQAVATAESNQLEMNGPITLTVPFAHLCNSEFPHLGAARTFSTECAVTVQ